MESEVTSVAKCFFEPLTTALPLSVTLSLDLFHLGPPTANPTISRCCALTLAGYFFVVRCDL
jgi:hypothetical protein